MILNVYFSAKICSSYKYWDGKLCQGKFFIAYDQIISIINGLALLDLRIEITKCKCLITFSIQGKNLEQEENIHNDIFTQIPRHLLSNENTTNHEVCKILRDKNCWMQMRGGSKIRNFITPSINSLNSSDIVIISGSGSAVTKVIFSY